MTAALREEIIKAALRACLGALIGLMLGFWQLGLFIGLLLYLLMHLRYLVVLRNWFEKPKQTELPEPGGVWGEVYDKLMELQKRNRKRKKKLAAILSEFQASTAALPDGAVVLGGRGEIAWFNAAAQKLLGLRSPQDVGQRIANLIRHPNFTDYLAEGSYLDEVEAPSPIRATQMLCYRIVPYGNGQRLLVARDISEIRRLESVRRDFVSNASHELRTPLTVLKGWLELLLAESGTGALAAWSKPLQEMKAQADRMENLMNDLLKLARLEAENQGLRADPVPLSALLQRVVDDARAVAKGSHRFETNIAPGIVLLGRELEVLSIITNLVANAVQYTPEGGIVRVSLVKNEVGVQVAVADTGIGISKTDLPRLTERFYRVDVARSRASGGTGLGLSIVKHALEQHEGHLGIESEQGVGSTFTAYFPASRIKIESEAPDSSGLAVINP